MLDLCSNVLTSRAGIPVEPEDLAHVELKSVSSIGTVFSRSIFVRFRDLSLRLVIRGVHKQVNFCYENDMW